MNKNIEISLKNQKDTEKLGEFLAETAVEGDIFALYGSLGVGKTAFARSFIRHLCDKEENVPSPTFTLVQTYNSEQGKAIWHFDMYRLKNPEEAIELDIDDAFFDGISLIEWPEKLGHLLPEKHIKIHLSMTNDTISRIANISFPSELFEHFTKAAETIKQEFPND